MIGALTMARVVTDPLLSDTILRSAAKPSPAYVWRNKQNSSGTHLGYLHCCFSRIGGIGSNLPATVSTAALIGMFPSERPRCSDSSPAIRASGGQPAQRLPLLVHECQVVCDVLVDTGQELNSASGQDLGRSSGAESAIKGIASPLEICAGRDVQITPQNSHHPRRTRMGRDWPAKPTTGERASTRSSPCVYSLWSSF